MTAMVVAERYLWVNLADIGRKEKGFLLKIKFIIKKFREAKVHSAALKTFIPRSSRSEPE